MFFFKSASLTLQLLSSLCSLAPIPLSPLHNTSYQHLRGSSCVLIKSRTVKSSCKPQWRSPYAQKTTQKKNISAIVLAPFQAVNLDRVGISGQEHLRLLQPLSPSKEFSILTELSLVTRKCPEVLGELLLSQSKRNAVSQQKITKK